MAHRGLIGVGLLASALACTCGPDEDVLGAFRAAKAEALAPPPPVVEPFEPDLVLQLSPGLVQRLVEIGLEGNERFRSKVTAPGGVLLTPDLRIERAQVVPGKGCESCVGAAVRLAGEVAYESGIVGKGKVPLTVDAQLDVVLQTSKDAAGWSVSAKPERVRRVSVEVPGLPRALLELAEDPLKDFAQAEVAKLEPYELFAVSGDELPLRGFRVEPDGAGVRVAMLSDAVRPGKVSAGTASSADWTLRASPESVTWLARREAFALGPQTLGVVAVPERFAMDGARFELGLRLWRTEPPGWWREYTATGTVGVEASRIRLSAKDVQETGQSSGAGMADPLALLAEGFIVDGIAEALQQTVPASGRRTAAGWKADVDVVQVVGKAGAIEVEGSLSLSRR